MNTAAGSDMDLNLFAKLLLQKADCLDVVRVFHGQQLGFVFLNTEKHHTILAGDAFGDELQDFAFDFFRIQLDIWDIDFFGVQLSQVFFVNQAVGNNQILQRLFFGLALFMQSCQLFSGNPVCVF